MTTELAERSTPGLPQNTQNLPHTVPTPGMAIDTSNVFSLIPKPESLDQVFKLCQFISESDCIPKHFFKKPSNLLFALQRGSELGLSYGQSISSIMVVNGKASVWGDMLLALIKHSGKLEDHKEWFVIDGVRHEIDVETDILLKAEKGGKSVVAFCLMKRLGDQEPLTHSFSIAEAKVARLWGKDGPWQTFPKRMLQLKPRNLCAKDKFSDVLMGLQMTEDVQEQTIDISPTRQPVDQVTEALSQPETKGQEVRAQLGEAVPVEQGDEINRESVKPSEEEQWVSWVRWMAADPERLSVIEAVKTKFKVKKTSAIKASERQGFYLTCGDFMKRRGFIEPMPEVTFS